MDSAYAQNIKNASSYIENIEKKGLAIFRGYSLNKNEKIIRHVINSLMCNYYVDLKEVSSYFNIDLFQLKEIIEFSKSKFNDFIDDKLMKITNEKIFINDSGRLFTRNISMRFDPLLSKKIGTYSRTI